MEIVYDAETIPRVLSDRRFRQSFITWPYCQPFSGKGIGKELGWRCIACFPDSEWFLETETAIDFIRN